MVAIERVSTMQLLFPGGDNGLNCHDQPFPQTAPTDDAKKFTSEMHDPCARSRCLQERTTQKHLQKAPVWSRPNTLRRLSQKCFYNSRVLEKSQSRVPFYEDVGAFYSSEVLPPFLAEQVLSLQPKSFPCSPSPFLAEQVFSL